MEPYLVPKAGTMACGTGHGGAFGCAKRWMEREPVAWWRDRRMDGRRDRRCAIVTLPLSHRLWQKPLSAAARWEGACHKRTVWLKHSGVLWINWILLTALLTCCILTGLGGDYRALEQISIHRSTQILGFNKNTLWLRHTADQIQPWLTPGAISLISVG